MLYHCRQNAPSFWQQLDTKLKVNFPCYSLPLNKPCLYHRQVSLQWAETWNQHMVVLKLLVIFAESRHYQRFAHAEIQQNCVLPSYYTMPVRRGLFTGEEWEIKLYRNCINNFPPTEMLSATKGAHSGPWQTTVPGFGQHWHGACTAYRKDYWYCLVFDCWIFTPICLCGSYL